MSTLQPGVQPTSPVGARESVSSESSRSGDEATPGATQVEPESPSPLSRPTSEARRPGAPLGEEARDLLRRILESHACRQLMGANIRGHGMQFLPTLDAKLAYTREIEFILRVEREVEAVHTRLGGHDLNLAVRDRMKRIPYPNSRLELAICIALMTRVDRVAAKGYRSCPQSEVAAVARSLSDAGRSTLAYEEGIFSEFCSREVHRPRAQEFWNRWLGQSLRALGRPGTAGDARAVALGLRDRHVHDVVLEYLLDVEPLRRACGLDAPDSALLGVELPHVLGRHCGLSDEIIAGLAQQGSRSYGSAS